MLKIFKYEDLNLIKNENVKDFITKSFNNVYETNKETMFEGVSKEDANLEPIGGFILIENNNDLDTLKNEINLDLKNPENIIFEWIHFNTVINHNMTTHIVDCLWLENDEVGYNLFIDGDNIDDHTLNRLSQCS